MVANYAIEHGHCATCGEEDTLFMIRIKKGPAIEILPMAEGSHTGMCQKCLQYFGHRLSKSRSYRNRAIDVSIETARRSSDVDRISKSFDQEEGNTPHEHS